MLTKEEIIQNLIRISININTLNTILFREKRHFYVLNSIRTKPLLKNAAKEYMDSIEYTIADERTQGISLLQKLDNYDKLSIDLKTRGYLALKEIVEGYALCEGVEDLEKETHSFLFIRPYKDKTIDIVTGNVYQIQKHQNYILDRLEKATYVNKYLNLMKHARKNS